MSRIELDGSFKKVIFYLETEKHARFLLHLRYRDFKSQGSFFRAVVDLCLEDDETMFETLQNAKGAIEARSRKRKIRADHYKLKQNIEDYNLTKEELDDLFSLIEEERGDLCEDA